MSVLPTNPVIGQLFYLASGAMYSWDGVAWTYVSGGDAGDPGLLVANIPVSLSAVLVDYTKVASQPEVDSGTVNNKAVTPLTLKSETDRVTGLIPTLVTLDARYLAKLERANNSLRLNGKTDVQLLLPYSLTTHVHPDVTIATSGFMTPADKVKLDSINVSLIGGATDAFLLDRNNHTGVQAMSTVSGLVAAITGFAPLASPVFTGTPTTPTAPNVSSLLLANTQFVLDRLLGYSAAGHTHVMADTTDLAPALALKAPLASPALTGLPTAPTVGAGDNTTLLATTAFVSSAVANLINAAPGALDTLSELATAMGNDPNYATTITNALALKAPLISPSLTGLPTAPTVGAGDNTTLLATTAFVSSAVANLINAAPANLDTLSELATAINNDPAYSTTVTNALALKAPLVSPALTGLPTAPTVGAGDNTTLLATTAFVVTAISGKLDAASYTPADILSKLLTVDGAGSGLDADTIDGFTTSITPIASTIVLRSATGDLTGSTVFGVDFQTTQALSSRNTDTIFYTSTDDVIRKNDGIGARASLDVVQSPFVMQNFDNQSGAADLDTLVASGSYRLGVAHPNAPAGSGSFGQLLVIHGARNTITQYYTDYIGSRETWIRSGSPPDVGGVGPWGPWNKVAYVSEGTFTPVYDMTTTSPTITYSLQQGDWVRFANVVTCWVRLTTDAASGGSGNIIVTGIPFLGSATGVPWSSAAVGYVGDRTVTNSWGSNRHPLMAIFNHSVGSLHLYRSNGGDPRDGTTPCTAFRNGTNRNALMLTVTFRV